MKKSFTEVFSDNILAASVLENSPIPDDPVLSLKKLDGDVTDLLPGYTAKHVRKQDSGYLTIARRIRFALGPLFQLWKNLAKARKDPKAVLDNNKLVRLSEQAVLCLGQAAQTVDHQRRMAVLTRIISKPRKCLEILARNDAVLKKNKELFGQSFYAALHRHATGNKKLREAKRELQPFRRRRGDGGQRGRPFRQGPSQSQPQRTYSREGQRPGRGSHFSRGRGRGGAIRKSDRYVSHNTTMHKHKANIANTGDTGETKTVSTGIPCGTRSIMFSEFTKHIWGSRKQGFRTSLQLGSGRHRNTGYSRQADQISPKLAESHRGPLGTRCDRRVRHRMGTETKADNPTKQSKNVGGTGTVVRHRGAQSNREGSNRTSRNDIRPIREPPISQAKERRVNETSIQPKETQQQCKIRTLQDGRNAGRGRSVTARRLAHKDRSQGRILRSSNSPKGQEVPEISMEGEDMAIYSSPIRSSIGTQGIHKNPETGDGSLATSRFQTSDMARRHSNDEPATTVSCETNNDNDLVTRETGIYDQHTKIDPEPETAVGIHGIRNRHNGNEAIASTSESRENPTRMQTAVTATDSQCKNTVESDRQNDSSSEGNLASTTAVQTSAETENSRVTHEPPQLRSDSDNKRRMSSRTDMVGREHRRMEREELSESESRLSDTNPNRRKQNRLGGPLQRSQHTGPMDTKRAETAHQCTRTEIGLFCSEGIHEGQKELPHTCTGRQHHSSSLHKSDGRHEIDRPSAGDERFMELLHVQKDHDYSRTCPRSTKSDSGLPEPKLLRQQQLEVKHTSVQGNREHNGTSTNGSICRQGECSKTQVHELEARPRRSRNGCILSDVDGSTGLCIPTFLPDRQMPSQDQTRSNNNDHDHTHMADTTLVSTDSRNEHSGPSASTSNEELTDVADRHQPPNDRGKQTDISSVESIGQPRPPANISESTRRLLDQTRRPSSKRTYAGPWEKWCSWCVHEQIDPLQAPVESIANFLASVFETPVEYSTLNVYRSAISAYHPTIEGYKVGQHPLIMDLMRGAFNAKPPQPKYAETWDVGLVLRYLRSQEPVENLELKDLTARLATLMALVSAGRSQELCSLDISLMQDFGDRVVFHLGKLTKSRRQSRPHQSLAFTEYAHDEDLDVMKCLRRYIKVTKTMRITDEQKHQLFLACVKPHKPVVPCTVARWLKSVMDKSGIDVSKYTAHSTRGASTSKANRMGLSVAQIMQRANWAKARTFYRFYNREVQNTDEFQNNVLA